MRKMAHFALGLTVLFLSNAASATDWSTCRDMGLSSLVECKKYDEDPVFRAQVRQKLGLPVEIIVQEIPAQGPPPSPISSCDNSGCRDNRGNRYVRGAGNTYIGPYGSCQMVANMMHCQ